MAVGIYKPGQGYWTRVMSAIGLALIVTMGVVWLWDLLAMVRIGTMQPVYVQSIVAIVVLAVFGALGYFILGMNRRVVDFMIATESEMKKVNWSTRREILGSTWVVIGLTVFIALFCFLADVAFQALFQSLNVLQAE